MTVAHRTTGADFWQRLESADAPALPGLRYAVLGIGGDRAYDNFCGHAKTLDARLAALGATRVLDCVECEAYDDAPMKAWAEQVAGIVGTDTPPAPSNPPVLTTTTSDTVPAPPLSRNAPLLAPLSRNIRLTPPESARKEVRQFGFDISEHVAEHGTSYAAGDSLGVFVTNSDEAVASWLACTGLTGSEIVEVDGTDTDLRSALTSSYDICRITPPTCCASSPTACPRQPGGCAGPRRNSTGGSAGATGSTSSRSSGSRPRPTSGSMPGATHPRGSTRSVRAPWSAPPRCS